MPRRAGTIVLFAAVAVWLTMMPAHAGKLDAVKTRGKLLVGVTESSSPFSYRDGATAGFALKKNEPRFLDFVTLLRLEASGEAAKIFDVWFAPAPRTFRTAPD